MPNHQSREPDRLDAFIALCKRVYARMEREGAWPWRDSHDRPDVVESKPNPHDL